MKILRTTALYTLLFVVNVNQFFMWILNFDVIFRNSEPLCCDVTKRLTRIFLIVVQSKSELLKKIMVNKLLIASIDTEFLSCNISNICLNLPRQESFKGGFIKCTVRVLITHILLSRHTPMTENFEKITKILGFT